MNTELPEKIIFPLILMITNLVLLTRLPGHFCQSDQQYVVCSQQYDCGPFRDISYPFWGGSRPAYCGHPGFELMYCDRDFPVINVSSILYLVMRMDNNLSTLRVAREDLRNNLCPFFLNTTLDFNLFNYYRHTNDSNVTLYYGCSGLNSSFNQFDCNNGGANNMSFYTIGEASTPGMCNSSVFVVNLLGFCNGKKERALVYEFMPNKSLDKFIYKSGSLSSSDNIHLGLDKLYEIVVGVARGLEYLHRGCNTRIVHFDIKPQNILLDENFCPKISDFGLAQLCKKKQSVLSVFGTRGTVGYIAPEVFSRNFGSVSHKSDVYSYGMMILEMAGARTIEENAENGSNESYFPDRVYEQGILRKTKKLLDETMSEEQEETARKMFLVGFWCIQTVPSERPSMNKVLEMLEGSVQSIQIPPKPFLASPMLSGQKFSSSFLGTENITE